MNQEFFTLTWDWITSHIIWIVLAFSVFFEITPIKIHPLSALIKWIGNKLNAGQDAQIKELIKVTDKLQITVDENEKDRIRWEILDFANSCRNGHKHSRDEFQHIIALNDKYRELLNRTGDRNGVFEMEYDWIMDIYRERLEKNDFLN